MDTFSLDFNIVDVIAIYFLIGILVLIYDGPFRTQLVYVQSLGFRYGFAIKILIVMFWPFRNALRQLIHRIGTSIQDQER